MNKKEDFKLTIERIKELKGSDSQEEFARRINMTQSNVSKLLNGVPPSASTLIAIAGEYDVSVDWLLGLSEQKKADRFPTPDNITYADVLAVFDILIENDSLSTYEMSDSSMFRILDRVLGYLIDSRLTVNDLDVNTRRFWYRNTAEHFADHKVVKWQENYDEVFEDFMPKKPEESDIIRFLKMFEPKDSNNKA